MTHQSANLWAAVVSAVFVGMPCRAQKATSHSDHGEYQRPNILIAISDDQSWLYTSAAGCKAVETPAFDRMASEGVLFRNAIAPSPSCSPSRACLLTGRYPWQIEQAGTHWSSFPKKYVVYPDLLEKAGYFVGYTGKGWAPGNWKVSGRSRNPAGPAFNQHILRPPCPGISDIDYAANFREFLAQCPKGRPFCFWYGAHEPHRPYDKGSGLKAGKKLADAIVPPFLPDTPLVRNDILDYCVEIDWFDKNLAGMLQTLKAAGQLDNTLVIVTSDQGMGFPRAKANCYEYGLHVPLAICWPKVIRGGRVLDNVVSFVDLTATILDAAHVEPPAAYPISGHSLLNILTSKREEIGDPDHEAVFAARERHSSSRFEDWGYPQRAIRTARYLYIRNFKPDRWPAGAPRILKKDGTLGPVDGAFFDIDPGLTKTFLCENHADPIIGKYLQLAVAKRPAEELYNIVNDPGCLTNLADRPDLMATRNALDKQLMGYLKRTGDPLVTGEGEIFDTYARYGPIRRFPPPEESSSNTENTSNIP